MTQYIIKIIISAINTAPVFDYEITETINLQVGLDFVNLALPTFTDADAVDSHVLTFTSTNSLYT